MNLNSLRSLTLLATIMAAGAANAASVSYSGTTGVVSSLGTVSLQQFDSSLGNLTGIAIEWDSGFSARFVAAQETPSNSGTVSGANGFITATLTPVTSPAGASGPNLSATAGTAFSVSVPPTYQQIVSGGNSASQAFGALAAFVGLGTVDYGFFGSASDATSASNGLLRGTRDFLYLVNADITYTYVTPYSVPGVPLPAALPLALAGLGLLGGLKLRRKR